MGIGFNPDGGGSRVFHVAARAKQRFGLDLELADIEDMERAIRHGDICPECAELLCDEGCRFAEMRNTLRRVKVSPHGHETWELTVRGVKVGALWDPKNKTVRTVYTPGKFDDHMTVPLGQVVRVKPLRPTRKKGL